MGKPRLAHVLVFASLCLSLGNSKLCFPYDIVRSETQEVLFSHCAPQCPNRQVKRTGPPQSAPSLPSEDSFVWKTSEFFLYQEEGTSEPAYFYNFTARWLLPDGKVSADFYQPILQTYQDQKYCLFTNTTVYNSSEVRLHGWMREGSTVALELEWSPRGIFSSSLVFTPLPISIPNGDSVCSQQVSFLYTLQRDALAVTFVIPSELRHRSYIVRAQEPSNTVERQLVVEVDPAITSYSVQFRGLTESGVYTIQIKGEGDTRCSPRIFSDDTSYLTIIPPTEASATSATPAAPSFSPSGDSGANPVRWYMVAVPLIGGFLTFVVILMVSQLLWKRGFCPTRSPYKGHDPEMDPSKLSVWDSTKSPSVDLTVDQIWMGPEKARVRRGSALSHEEAASESGRTGATSPLSGGYAQDIACDDDDGSGDSYANVTQNQGSSVRQV